MPRIVKSSLLAAAVVACSPTAPPSATQEDPPAIESPAAGPTLLRLDEFSLACNADTLSSCAADACTHEAGATPSVPLALGFDGEQGQGELCIATGCSAVDVVAPPGDPPAPGEDIVGLLVSAPVLFDEASGEASAGPPTLFDGVVTFAPDGGRFSIVQTNAGGAMIWAGSCAPAGAN